MRIWKKDKGSLCEYDEKEEHFLLSCIAYKKGGGDRTISKRSGALQSLLKCDSGQKYIHYWSNIIKKLVQINVLKWSSKQID